MSDVIIALGSNHECLHNIKRAMEKLDLVFSDIHYTSIMRTGNVGSHVYGIYFMNALAHFKTECSQEYVSEVLKKIEKECGDNRELRKSGKVVMDIDLLLYDDVKFHDKDWERYYIKELIKEL